MIYAAACAAKHVIRERPRRPDERRIAMVDRISFAALAFATALGASVSAAQDDRKYPDLKGQWVRGTPEAPDLTPPRA